MKRSISPRGNPDKSVFGILGAAHGSDDGNFYVKIKDDSRNTGWTYVGQDNTTPTSSPTPTPTPTPSTFIFVSPTPTPSVTRTHTPTRTPTPTKSVTPSPTPSMNWSV